MTSLTDVYEGSTGEMRDPRRLYAGTALVLFGAILAVVAVLMAATDLFSGFVTALSWEMAPQYASVRIAGGLAGLGVPAALVGVFIVLPANRRVKAAAAISASLCLFGVVLFWHAYPYHWNGVGEDLTFQVSVVYLLGLFTAVWCLFTAVVNFKTRNDPGGMLEMNVTRHNQTILEVSDEDRESSQFGGVGFLGGTPDGEVETQTNAPGAGTGDEKATTDSEGRSSGDPEPARSSDPTTADEDGGTILSSGSKTGPDRSNGPTKPRRGLGGVPSSDGGSAASDVSSPLDEAPTGENGAEIVESAASGPNPDEPTDRYCGNCRHFEYVRSTSGMVPYCGYHEQAMDNMDACEEWMPNRR
ncbi:hypothetical protein EA462_09780 [Natrarchaeobius halalkaliphilus]|uniref:Uncharacterized protein n=1 Tax=Natrarchaeobius halalkaliphilus TaxID=1679091 RepID=A0A3N6M337_9EURY|nr:hypothetical protein [Natrarchaeobius halalkaliphilus]RQG90260.1 hypothetical protein EA462_09780 [Natrarchaeobius halalkaliphilus]